MTSREITRLRLQGEDPREIREWTYDRAPFLADPIRIDLDDWLAVALYSLDSDRDGLVVASREVVEARVRLVTQ